LFQAFFQDGKDLDDPQILAQIGAAAGLDPGEIQAALDRGTFRGRVLEDERQAAQLGIQAVPTMLVRRDGEAREKWQAISGAMPYEAVKAAVERARNGG
jgi:predicted DsbA family dithiol-disulfide isomerase